MTFKNSISDSNSILILNLNWFSVVYFFFLNLVKFLDAWWLFSLILLSTFHCNVDSVLSSTYNAPNWIELLIIMLIFVCFQFDFSWLKLMLKWNKPSLEWTSLKENM